VRVDEVRNLNAYDVLRYLRLVLTREALEALLEARRQGSMVVEQPEAEVKPEADAEAKDEPKAEVKADAEPKPEKTETPAADAPESDAAPKTQEGDDGDESKE
jgi:hypothetical protein